MKILQLKRITDKDLRAGSRAATEGYKRFFVIFLKK